MQCSRQRIQGVSIRGSFGFGNVIFGSCNHRVSIWNRWDCGWDRDCGIGNWYGRGGRGSIG